MSQPPEPVVTGLRQIALSSAHPDSLANFYTKALGLPRLFETNGMIFLDAGAGVRLMIGPRYGEQPIGGDVALYFEPVLWDIAEAAVVKAGGVFAHDAATLQRADGRVLLLRAFKDPEGHAVALLGWRAA